MNYIYRETNPVVGPSRTRLLERVHMKNREKQPSPARKRKNRRVTVKISPIQLLRERLGRATILIHNVLRRSLFGLAALVGPVWVAAGKISVGAYLRRFLIVVGWWTRTRIWPATRPVLRRLGSIVTGMLQCMFRWNTYQKLKRATESNVRKSVARAEMEKGTTDGMVGGFFGGFAWLMSFLNPARVRIESPMQFRRHSRWISGVFLMFLLGAGVWGLAVAAGIFSRDEIPDSTEILARMSPGIPANGVPAEGGGDSGISPASSAAFYNPFYVFTGTEAKGVSAYPLADPPGLVVDVHGVSESDRSPEQMVGDDDRVLGVRRIRTSKGLRYIIRLSQSIRRIKSHTEGNVITVSPIS
jgi:hypothetical protein